MDPLSQGTLGAIYSQSASNKKQIVAAGFIGFLSGLLPDADVLIRSKTDPLLSFEFHRHFTHSIAFMPVGALVATFILYPFFKKYLNFKKIYVFSLIGYATHAPLDACTSYGTQLFWPFSNYRVAWDFISIIDPLFTFPIFALMVLALIRKNPLFARAGVIYGLFYMSLGATQEYRARNFALNLAQERGHSPQELTVKPTLANIILWKTIYQHNGQYYVDAAHLGFKNKLYPGSSLPKLDLERDFPWLNSQDTQYRDVQRFSWFSSGYLAVHPSKPNVIGDMRYSFAPNDSTPLWGILLRPENQGKHVPIVNFRSLRNRSSQLSQLWHMVLGKELD